MGVLYGRKAEVSLMDDILVRRVTNVQNGPLLTPCHTPCHCDVPLLLKPPEIMFLMDTL